MLFITHDLALARAYAERIVVMHAGQFVEEAPTAALFAAPRHPYSAALIGATPADAATVGDLKGIAGTLPRARPRAAGVPLRRALRARPAALPQSSGRRSPSMRARHAAACWAPL